MMQQKGKHLARTKWHITRHPKQLTLSRHLPARFDVSAEAELVCEPSVLDPVRLAHQIRQDTWRALQGLRGFSPTVELCAELGGIRIRAGGRLLASGAAKHVRELHDILTSPENQRRWLRYAARGKSRFEGI